MRNEKRRENRFWIVRNFLKNKEISFKHLDQNKIKRERKKSKNKETAIFRFVKAGHRYNGVPVLRKVCFSFLFHFFCFLVS